MADDLRGIAAVLVMQLTKLLMHTLLAKEMVLNSSRTLTMFISGLFTCVAPAVTTSSSIDAANWKAFIVSRACVSRTRDEQCMSCGLHELQMINRTSG
jgi:hypothetical protein